MDLLISFDTTGSMSSCIKMVRKNLQEFVNKMFTEIPKLRVSIVAHGDYCDKNRSYLMKSLDFTTDFNKIIKFITETGDTGGGDYPEAYEYVLREIQKLSWESTSMRALVMIGDAYPHPKDQNPEKIDWKEEVENINKMGINIYSVQALNSGNGQSYTFYKQMAQKTNGYHLFLDQFSYITDILMAICFKQLGEDYLIKYQQEITRTKYGMNISMRKVFDTMLGLNTVGVDSLGVDIPDEDSPVSISSYNPDDDVLIACPSSKYQIMEVDNNTSIKDFVLSHELTFKVGKGFYEFTKPETISDKKAIVLMKKTTGELFEGKKARHIAKFTDGTKKYKPSDLPDYYVFIQSTSANRNLMANTKFLYEASDYGL